MRQDGVMAKIPESTKDSVENRLAARARERWPDLRPLPQRPHRLDLNPRRTNADHH